MSKFIGIKEASELTGLSVTTLRRGVHSGRFPAIRANRSQGKILFAPEALIQVLGQEALDNLLKPTGFEDEAKEKEEPRSYLAGLFDDIPSQLPDGYNNSNNKTSATIVLNNHTTKAPQ